MPRLPNGHSIDNFYGFVQTILVFNSHRKQVTQVEFSQVRECFSRNLCASSAEYALTDLEVSVPGSMIETQNIHSGGRMSA